MRGGRARRFVLRANAIEVDPLAKCGDSFVLEPDASLERIEAALVAMHRVGLIDLRYVDSKAFAEFVNFEEHNSTRKEAASRIPAPSGVEPALLRREPDRRGATPDNSGPPPGVSGLTPEVAGVTPEENGPTPEDGGVTPREDGPTLEDDGAAQDNDGVAPTGSGPTQENDRVTQDNDRVAQKDIGSTPTGSGPTAPGVEVEEAALHTLRGGGLVVLCQVGAEKSAQFVNFRTGGRPVVLGRAEIIDGPEVPLRSRASPQNVVPAFASHPLCPCCRGPTSFGRGHYVSASEASTLRKCDTSHPSAVIALIVRVASSGSRSRTTRFTSTS